MNTNRPPPRDSLIEEVSRVEIIFPETRLSPFSLSLFKLQINCDRFFFFINFLSCLNRALLRVFF